MHSKFNETIKFKSFEKFHRRLLAFQYHTGYKFVQGSSIPLASCHSSKLKSNVEFRTRLRYYYCPFSCEYGSKKKIKRRLIIVAILDSHNHQSVPVLFLDGTLSPDETVAEESTPAFETIKQGTKKKRLRIRNLRSCRNQHSGNVSVNSSDDDVELPPVRPGGNTVPESQKQPSAVPPADASEELTAETRKDEPSLPSSPIDSNSQVPTKQFPVFPPADASEELTTDTRKEEPSLPSSPIDGNSQVPTEQPPAVSSASVSEELTAETREKEPGLPSSPIDGNSQVPTEQPPAVPSAGASEELTAEIREKEPSLPSSQIDGNRQVPTEQPPSVVAENLNHSYACSSKTIAITTNRRKRKKCRSNFTSQKKSKAYVDD
ncbi:hypothetical protein KQX54_015025 [Cotesia glomerata]|uniref:Uncharacterized protein n=1 Tax=Cotesia glomerata TaxID=32391 RepID=A0AAV7J6U9_COTGL|nr:hypothetical protein KQX54_015025 [Cotesia glomerata]